MDVTAQDKPSLESLISHPEFSKMTQNLANHFAKAFWNSPMIEMADLLSEALLAATTAYTSFDMARHEYGDVNKLFRIFAYPYMKHAVQTYCNKFCHSLTISEKAARFDLKSMTEIGILRLDQVREGTGQDNNGDAEVCEYLNHDGLAVGSGVETHIDIDEFFFAGFTQTEKELAREFMLNDLSIRELAVKYDISKSRIGSILNDLRDRMQERARKYVEED